MSAKKPTALLRRSPKGYLWSLYSRTGKRIAVSARYHPSLQSANGEVNGLIRTTNGKGVIPRVNIGTKQFPPTYLDTPAVPPRKRKGKPTTARKTSKARGKARVPSVRKRRPSRRPGAPKTLRK